jgi:hypothetical protein
VSVFPRFFLSSNAGGPLVFDRQRGLAAGFLFDTTAREVARLLNANPAMVAEFDWSTNAEGAASD